MLLPIPVLHFKHVVKNFGSSRLGSQLVSPRSAQAVAARSDCGRAMSAQPVHSQFRGSSAKRTRRDRREIVLPAPTIMMDGDESDGASGTEEEDPPVLAEEDRKLQHIAELAASKVADKIVAKIEMKVLKEVTKVVDMEL